MQCLEIYPPKYCWHWVIWQHWLSFLRELVTKSTLLSFKEKSSLKFIKESFSSQSAIHNRGEGFFILIVNVVDFCHTPCGKLNTCLCLSIKRFNKQYIRQSPTIIHGSAGRLKICVASQPLMYTCTSTNDTITSQYCGTFHSDCKGIYAPLYGIVPPLALILPASFTRFCSQAFSLAKLSSSSVTYYYYWAVTIWISPPFLPFVNSYYSHLFIIESLSNSPLCIIHALCPLGMCTYRDSRWQMVQGLMETVPINFLIYTSKKH